MNTLTEKKSAVKWEDNFDRQLVAAWLDNLGMIVPANRFRDCGTPGMGWVGVCLENPKHQVYHAFGCDLRICPRCAYRRSYQLEQRLTPAIVKMMASAPPEFRLVHITLGTDINILDYMDVLHPFCLDGRKLYGLREIIKLYRGFVSDLLRRYQSEGLVLGWGTGIEFGFQGGLLHFHVLALSKFIPQRKISDDWEEINLHRGRYVWIRQVGRGADEIAKSVSYITKYVTHSLSQKSKYNAKFTNSEFMTDKEIDTRGKIGMGGVTDNVTVTDNVARMDAFVALHGVEPLIAALAYVFKGVRRFQTYGCFYDLEVPPDEPEACPTCGAALHWMREIDWGLSSLSADLVKSLNTNKFVLVAEILDVRINDPPINLLLPGF